MHVALHTAQKICLENRSSEIPCNWSFYPTKFLWVSSLDEVFQDHWIGSSYIFFVSLVENISA